MFMAWRWYQLYQVFCIGIFDGTFNIPLVFVFESVFHL